MAYQVQNKPNAPGAVGFDRGVRQTPQERAILLAVAFGFAVAALESVPAHARIVEVRNTRMVARLTGAASINQTDSVRIGGTDLGHMAVHEGRTYFFFGDTFSGETSVNGGLWRHNTVAFSTDPDPSDGIRFDGWLMDARGVAREVIHSGLQNPITEIPTGAISLDGRLHAWFMSVNWWGPPSIWTANYGGLAVSDDGSSFTVVDGFAFPGDGNFVMVAASRRVDDAADPYVYVWGTPAGRQGGVKLARVLPASATNVGAYEYFAGLVEDEPTWVADESRAPLIVPPTVGEMSVMYNQASKSWMMMYSPYQAWPALREAPAPWGPWSEPLTIAIPTVPGASGAYAPYMNPLYVENGGETVYFTLSFWEPYDVYLMKTMLVIETPVIEPCPASPRQDCLQSTEPAKSQLQLKDTGDNTGDQITWKWLKGEATAVADFGDPVNTDDYALCIYDESGPEPALLFGAVAPAGGTCAGKPCWTAAGAGFKYGNKEAVPDGLTGIKLKAGSAGKAALQVKGKGEKLESWSAGFPSPPLGLPLRVQFQLSEGTCWETRHTASSVLKNVGGTFAARGE